MSATDNPMMLCHIIANNNNNDESNKLLQVAGSGMPAISALRGLNSNRTNRAASRKSRVYYMYQFLVSTYPSIFQSCTDDENIKKDNLYRKHSETIALSGSNSNKNSTRDCLQQGDDVIILDVAGGKGDLSWFINNLHPALSSPPLSPSSYPCHSNLEKDEDSIYCNKTHHTTSRPRKGVHSIVLDPRPIDHRRLVKSAHFLENIHPELVQQRNVPGSTTFQPLAALLPHLIKCRDFYHNINQRSRNHYNDDDMRVERKRSISSTPQSSHGVWKEAGSLRIHVDAELVQSIQKCTTCPISSSTSQSHQPSTLKECNKTPQHYDPWAFKEWESYLKRAQSRTDPSLISQAQATTEYAKIVLDTLTQAKLIIGFHPDQATEAIVDLAIHLQIPYCIVPCCVFPSEFPSRNVVVPLSKPSVAQKFIEGKETVPSWKCEGNDREGESSTKKVKVRDYALFLEYLRCKDPKVRIGKLGFPFTQTAKNVVLYTLPQDMIKQDETEIPMDD